MELARLGPDPEPATVRGPPDRPHAVGQVAKAVVPEAEDPEGRHRVHACREPPTELAIERLPRRLTVPDEKRELEQPELRHPAREAHRGQRGGE